MYGKKIMSLWILGGIIIGLTPLLLYLWYGYSLSQQKDECAQKYNLTSLTLDCDAYEESADRLRTLSTIFDEAIALYIEKGKAIRVAVFVRDLETKQWAASNEFEKFTPASLMKLPLMIAYLKVGEIEPSLLTETLVYQRSTTLNSGSQNFKPAKTLIEGGSYTVEQLIEQMIVYSDNDAAALLLSHLDQKIFNNTLVDLGIQIPNEERPVDFVAPKSYANIFRILYTASYLNRDMSQKALTLMSRSSFKGVRDALPPDVIVAHKFGEHEEDDITGTATIHELHDCGIVYKNENPYSICIMTEGKNFDDLLSIIKELSALTYKNIF